MVPKGVRSNLRGSNFQSPHPCPIPWINCLAVSKPCHFRHFSTIEMAWFWWCPMTAAHIFEGGSTDWGPITSAPALNGGFQWYPSWIANLGVDWVLDGRFLEEFKGDTDMKICGYSTILQEIPQSGSVVSLTILMMSGSYPLLLDPERPWTGFIKARGYASNHESINSPKIGHPWVQK